MPRTGQAGMAYTRARTERSLTSDASEGVGDPGISKRIEPPQSSEVRECGSWFAASPLFIWGERGRPLPILQFLEAAPTEETRDSLKSEPENLV